MDDIDLVLLFVAIIAEVKIMMIDDNGWYKELELESGRGTTYTGTDRSFFVLIVSQDVCRLECWHYYYARPGCR